MLKGNKGITLIALIVTIIILLILAGIGITAGRESIRTAKDNKVLSELEMIHHAILEKYSEAKLINSDAIFIGTEISYNEAQTVASSDGRGVTLPNSGTYYRIQPNELENLGLVNGENKYIVNYEKGIVINESVAQTYSGEILYRSAN